MVVSDTTSVSNFLQIGKLEILKNLFSDVYISHGARRNFSFTTARYFNY